MSCRIVVLISGSGSNLQAFIDTLHGRQANIVAVISNRDDAFGLERAARAGIPTAVLSHRAFADRASYDQALAALIDTHAPDLVILAGFMRILTAEFAHHYQGRLLNIHPSLLPKYPGLHTHQRALQAGDHEHGATVHFVTEELDGGPPILQSHVPVLSDDTPESLAERVRHTEHRLYPLAAMLYANGRLRLLDGRACLDGAPLAPSGLRLDQFETDTRGHFND
ncbi:formyltetrahydrofolate-dependent phosphoribosylglycinamide formyltransferase [Halopseudomonas litoralis]|uniref:Phosphoribosylglycinamide formyltransferase n=1 Tax=Halopseudomonas litoralis TaxID=797277 RepID=A0A1H1ME25_9GAMM|nr:phosphoribosylglycinamide formyltransferase [Halopseudomonas litoralis]SDR85063.1 formyltetrahydrofolate-dependent phosphoribosylglycinamide formyltransferase [Halopseudomonas litoralis]